ncbi:type 1 periplasmic-binding domain-containing protein [Aerococcus christensenii]|uniref:hypothetical protein n=1 Tax=Aerococcus christensenii TaxID=87541 RepID=UPI0007632962|nr:hypothetical protein [Aerococcus christensenii]AMB92557.1 hypothetical protein AWM71_04290 [Aerococcus christensenii]
MKYNIDALILQPVLSDISDYDLLINRSFPVTLLDRSLKQSSWLVVQSDNLMRTEELAQLIVEKGYQQVIHFTGSIQAVSPRYERYMAMKFINRIMKRTFF